MKTNELLTVEMLEEEIVKIELRGNNSIKGFIENWLEIKNLSNISQKVLVIDNMKGEISCEGICLLIEMLSEYDFYRKKKIAVVLGEDNAYSTRFYDVIAQNWGLNIKHFNAETEAVKWLSFR
jgi:hypothetical protein